MEYHPISTENLKIDTVLNFNIYIKQKTRYVLFREKQHPFTEAILSKLLDNKLDTVYVTEEGLVEFEKYFFSLQDGNATGMTNDGFIGPVFNDPENVKKYYKAYFDYYPIENDTLIPGSKVGFNVYKKKELDVELYFGPASLYDKPDIVPEDILALKQQISINKEDIYLYKEYLEEITKDYSRYKSASMKTLCSIIREDSKLVVREVFEDPKNGQNLSKCKNVVGKLVETVLYNENNFYNLLKINSYDYYTYSHSINVCTLSVGLATAINMKKDDIMQLALGAVFHDIGKSLVDPRIINKPGRLTAEEFKAVQKHVVNGKNLLEREHRSLSKEIFLPVLQHHEKLSGKGYPYHVKGDQIHIFGRITAIVDFYDALTTTRPYRAACDPFATLQMFADCSGDYDAVLLKEFVMMLGIQAGEVSNT